MGKRIISVSIDFGADTTKAAYSYKSVRGDYVCKLLFENGKGIPSMAYYDADKDDWVFDKDEILLRAKESFCYLVKVKELFDLFFTRASDGLYNKSYFKTFYYPPKASESYADAVANGRCFRAGASVRTVCSLFVKHCIQKVEKEIAKRFGDIEIRYVVVYPANAPKNYIQELVGFVSAASVMKREINIISAPRAVGIAAKEYGIVTKEQNSLLFNIGEEEISVVKMHFDQSNISVYSADGHSSPAKIGGKNIDIALAKYLFDRSADIGAFGDREVGKDVEKGVFFDQFRMQEGIKAGKKVFSDGAAYKRLGGFVFSIYREMITTIKMVQADFEECCRPVFKKIWEYVRDEIREGDNKDVKSVIFSGGAADTYGLDKYIQKNLHDYFPQIRFLDFSPENEDLGYDEVLCAAKDTVPIGAALYGAGKYKFKLLTTFAYGTYKFLKKRELNAFDQFVPKGTEIDLEGKVDFKIEMMAAAPLKGKPFYVHDRGEYLIFNEYYKCIPPQGFTGADEWNAIVFKKYTPEASIKQGAAAGEVRFKGEFLMGEMTDDVTLTRIGCYLMVFHFPKDMQSNKDTVGRAVYFNEGFEIDFEGRVTPIVKNVSERSYRDYNKMNEYDKIYQKVELTLEPNGTRVMSIND